jgi:hypothetical protein
MSGNKFTSNGSMSGFNSDIRTAVAMILETMLAAASRLRQHGNDYLMPIAGEDEREYVHFLLPKGAEEITIKNITFTTRENTKNEGASNVTEVVYDYDSKRQEDFEKTDLAKMGDWDCYRIESIKSEKRDFYSYIVQWKHEGERMTSYLCFFNDDMVLLDAHQDYIRHLCTGNFVYCTDEQNTYKRYAIDLATGMPRAEETVELLKIDHDEDVSNEVPEITELNMMILPVVNPGKRRHQFFHMEQHKYAELLFEYITAIRDSGVYMKPKISGPEENLIIDDILMIGKYEGVGNRHRVNISIALKDRSIARLIFGSSARWFPSNQKFHSYGNGCITKRFYNDVDSLVKNLLNPGFKDNGFNEMLGLTNEEIEDRIFVNASQYRALIGLDKNILELVDMYNGRNEDRKSAFEKIYNEIFRPFINNIAKPISNSSSSGNNAESGKDRSVFIKLLQLPTSILGHRGGSAQEIEDGSKLIYEPIDALTLGLRPAIGKDGVYIHKKPDGGQFLYLSSSVIKLRDTENAMSRAKYTSGSTHNAEYLRKIILSAQCPFGRIARKMWMINKFFPSQCDFFIPSTVTSLIDSELNLTMPFFHKLPTVKLTTSERGAYLWANETNRANFFVAKEERQNIDMKRKLFPRSKEICEEFIKTQDFFELLMNPKTDNVQENSKNNNEFLFCVLFAETARRFNKKLLESYKVTKTENMYTIPNIYGILLEFELHQEVFRRAREKRNF